MWWTKSSLTSRRPFWATLRAACYTKCLGGVRLADGTLAGSTLTMDQALRNLVAIGLPLEEASARVSRHAADYLRLADRGRLAVGAWADLVLLDARTLQLQQVCIEGEAIAVAD